MEKLPGDYIAGFVDGEGCFALKFRRDVRYERTGKPVYFYWDIEFAIVLRQDDKEVLEKIKNTLNCGKIHKPNKSGSVRYAVNTISDLLNIIAPFFEKYPLHAKKRLDFRLWKEALVILNRNQQRTTQRSAKQVGFSKIHWNRRDIHRLERIQEEMRIYKSKRGNWKWIHKVSEKV